MNIFLASSFISEMQIKTTTWYDYTATRIANLYTITSGASESL